MLKTNSKPVDFSYSEQLIKNGSKTFHFASRFMGRERRNAFYAIYSFCRHTDNLVDDNEGKPKRQKRLIGEWRKEFLKAHKTGDSSDKILKPFVYVMKRYRIPVAYPLELIRGVSMDITKKEYRNFRELRVYCYRVASVVGIMLSYVMGITSLKKAKRYATKLGIAMQLTNIIRDIGEDALMGRVYLPKDELERFGITISDILSLKKTGNLIEFLKFQMNRARKYYQEAINGLKMIHREVRLVVALALSLYSEILKVIEENGYEVYTKRAYVKLYRKILIYLKLWLSSLMQLT